MTFLETVISEYNRMRSRAYTGDYEGVTHAGICLLALDTRRIFLAQRTMDETDDIDVQETWEFPGGGLNEGEEPYTGAVRELIEETGLGIPEDAAVSGGWRSDDGVYQGFLVTTAVECDLGGWTPTDECQAVGWFDREMIEENENLRSEVRDQTDWDYIFSAGRQEGTMTEAATEPEFDLDFVMEAPIPVHGILAPEDVETGDKRGFNAGSMTTRPLRLPFSYQKVSIGGHDGSEVVGSVDRLMRKDGLIHWEGMLMPSSLTEEFIDVLSFFGRYGVSVDGDNGSMDTEKTMATGVLWFDAVRAAGLTAVSIPAFHQAYVAFGYHPEMDGVDDEAYAVMTASGDVFGGRQTFDRGPGWITNPRETKNIHDYWTKKGEEGYAKIGWGTPGDFRRAKALIGAKIAKHSPEKMKYLNQIIAQWHHDALGYWPGDLGKPGNAPDTAENRRRAAAHASLLKDLPAAFDIEPLPDDLVGEAYCLHDDCHEEAVYEVSSDEEMFWGCFCAEHAPEHENKSLWNTDAILTASVSGNLVRPPMAYFDRHDTTENCIIEEPDANGFRRTYGYAWEWGVCHIGFDGKCVEPPEDATNNNFAHFHLGRTKTEDGYIKTGLITYGVEHRDAEEILAQEPTRAHFEDLSRAWAAVRLGEDDRGGWFSGVVLPTVEEKWIVAIEASGQVSGEWKHGALRTLLTVGVPGFPVVESSAVYDDDGEVLALAASAFGGGLCAPTPEERMQALRIIDAEIRFAELRQRFLAERA